MAGGVAKIVRAAKLRVSPARFDARSGHPKLLERCHLAKEEGIPLEGKVLEPLPNATFRVQIPTAPGAEPHIVLARVSGKMRKHFIRILPGDDVTVEVSPYDLTKGRITYRKR